MPAPLPDTNRDHQCYHYQAPTGARCGSPAIKGEYYCYHHHISKVSRQQRRILIDPEITCMEIPPLEDRASIFIALAAVVHRLAENTIDTRRAGQMIYGLQVAMRALEPPPSQRCRTDPAAQSVAEPQPAADSSSFAGSSPAAPCQHAAQPATCNSQPATPRTIPITRESLIYFLRSRHCYNCNAELFPAEELTYRRNAGAPSEIIEETNPRLSAPERPSAQAAIAPSDSASTENDAVILNAVKDPGISSAATPSIAMPQPATDNLQLSPLSRRSQQPTGITIHIHHPVCFTLC